MSEIMYAYYKWGGILIALLVVLALVSVTVYVVNSIFVGKALKKIGYKNYWFIWIPFLSSFAIADLAEEDENGLVSVLGCRFEGKIFKFYWLVALLVSSFTLILPFGVILSAIINALCGAICYKKLYSCYEDVDTSAMVWKVLLLLSGVIPLIPMIKCILYRSIEPISTLDRKSNVDGGFTYESQHQTIEEEF